MFDYHYQKGRKYREKGIRYLDQALAAKTGSVEKKRAWRKYELCNLIADRHMEIYRSDFDCWIRRKNNV